VVSEAFRAVVQREVLLLRVKVEDRYGKPLRLSPPTPRIGHFVWLSSNH